MAISAYTKTTWANSPSTTTPTSAANFQHIEDQVKDITDACLTVTTWTPTIIGSSTPGTQTYTSQKGTYVKIGKLVFVQAEVIISAKDAAMAGNVYLGGLPVAVSATYYASMAVGQFKGFTLTANYTQVGIECVSGTTTMAVVQSGSAQTPVFITVANLAAASNIIFSGVYLADS